MWSYLKSDLEELVSVVKEDTGVVLEKIGVDDAKKNDSTKRRLTPAMKEVLRRMNEEETFTVPLFELPKSTTTTTAAAQEENSSAVAVVGDSTTAADASEETANLVTTTSTTTEIVADDEALDPLDIEEAKEVEMFRASFNIKDRTDEIAQCLEMYPDTLKVQFENLVPEIVRYDEFWERYFYRCNEQRIEHEWAEEDERARKARAQLVGSVSNFFGVAAKAVASGVASALTEDDSGGHRSSSSKGLVPSIFGGNQGRPPFVMNTAVDEDDDDEDEEEELGWDDDEEEDEEEAAVPTEISAGMDRGAAVPVEAADEEPEEQIVFKDAALEAMTEQLKQAIEERDQLHETVKLQTQEIVQLKKQTTTEASSSSVAVEGGTIESNKSESTTKDMQVESLTKEMQRVTELLAARELELSNLQSNMAASTRDFEANIASLTMERETLQLTMADSAQRSASQVKALEDDNHRLQSMVTTLEKELKDTRQSLSLTQTENSTFKAELERVSDELRRMNETTSQQMTTATTVTVVESSTKTEEDSGSGTKSAQTMDTVSTGVKIDQPTTIVSKIVATAVGTDDDDEEGWGDDWD